MLSCVEENTAEGEDGQMAFSLIPKPHSNGWSATGPPLSRRGVDKEDAGPWNCEDGAGEGRRWKLERLAAGSGGRTVRGSCIVGCGVERHFESQHVPGSWATDPGISG